MFPKPTTVDLILDATAGGKALLETVSVDVTTAGTFKLVNGTNRQIFEIFNNLTSGTSSEGIRLKTVLNANYELGAFQGSVSGNIRSLSFGSYARATPTVLDRWIEFNLSTGEANFHGGLLQVRKYGDVSTASQIISKKYRGTESVPTALLNNDVIMQVLGQGYNGSTIATCGAFQIQAAGDFDPASAPTRVLFNTTPSGSITAVTRGLFTEGGIFYVGPFSTSVPVGGLMMLVGNNGSGGENNTLRFHDTAQVSGIGQVLGKIEFYSADASAPGVGVKSYIASISEGAGVAISAIVFATDLQTGTPIERMRVTSSGTVRTERLIGQTAEVVYTPLATTQTIPLDAGRMQTLTLVSTTGSTTVTLTVPTLAADGSIIVKQHGTTPRAITWAVSAGTIKWLGTQPTWASDAVNAVRNVRWRWDGSVMHLESSAAG